MQIKTIIKRRDLPERFDIEVNKALADGFEIERIWTEEGMESSVRVYHPVLCALLIKRDNGDKNR